MMYFISQKRYRNIDSRKLVVSMNHYTHTHTHTHTHTESRESRDRMIWVKSWTEKSGFIALC